MNKPDRNAKRPQAPENKSHLPDLVCFSHLRWNSVFQRPHHLMSRWGRERRVFYIEEFHVDSGPRRIEVYEASPGVRVAVPYILSWEQEERDRLPELYAGLFSDYNIEDYLFWYYSPMFMRFTKGFHPQFCVYDCMDELSVFKGASPHLPVLEKELLEIAGVVFTGGYSLYEAKKALHPNVYPFPSSIDAAHFAQARRITQDPSDQEAIPAPRLGYFGVIDERMDLDLLASVADLQPDWHIVLVGPTSKVDEDVLPKRPNIHYLGQKPYTELPAYLAGWDVALLPFGQHPSTQYISPTKTPEYLAGGKPVVSSPIPDVIRTYAEAGLVRIAAGDKEFVQAVSAYLDESQGERENRQAEADALLAKSSWDDTWHRMKVIIEAGMKASDLDAGENPAGAASLPGDRPRKSVIKDPAPETKPTRAGRLSPPASSEQDRPGRKPPSRTREHNGKPAPRRGADSGHPTATNPTGSLDGGSPTKTPATGGNGNGRKDRPFDYLIVGAGFAGSVLAERLGRGSGKKVLVVDQRPHIAGNAYDHYDKDGLLVHKYGPHIFHTNSREVFAYLSRFTEWRPYEHRVRASVDGQLVPIPINLDTVNRLYGLNLTSFELQEFFDQAAERVAEIKTSEDVVVSKVGRELYEKFFRNYTRKQWGLDPSELDASVTSRVPVRLNRDDRYFGDTYQSMPRYGYTHMFENMLDHPNIKIMLNTSYQEIVDLVPHREVIFTGPVDEFFNYRYGRLPYRSLDFQFHTLNEAQHQPVAVINYPNEHAYTRVTEFKHLTGQEHSKTSLVYEYPCSEGDPYYPIPRPENAELYKKYKTLAEATPGVHFAGRLATYRYYNMDQVTAQALALYARLMGLKKTETVGAHTPAAHQAEVPCSLLGSQAVED